MLGSKGAINCEIKVVVKVVLREAGITGNSCIVVAFGRLITVRSATTSRRTRPEVGLPLVLAINRTVIAAINNTGASNALVKAVVRRSKEVNSVAIVVAY